MVMPIVYVTRRLPGPALGFLGEHCDVRVWEGDLPPPAEEVRRQAVDVDGLLTLLTDRIDRELLAIAALLIVSNMATGSTTWTAAATDRRWVRALPALGRRRISLRCLAAAVAPEGDRPRDRAAGNRSGTSSATTSTALR
jgi:hypothetical protein